MKKVSIDKASYEGYAVLKGGEVIKLFNDNSDLVTDRDSNAFPVEVSIGGKKKTIDFIRRGRNCDLQRNLLKKIGENITVSTTKTRWYLATACWSIERSETEPVR